MNLCSESHDEVCYDSRRCPVCDMRADKEAVDRELLDVKVSYETALETIEELRGDIEELRQEPPHESES